ncbi:hypothetical protein [Streptomyces sp. NPDC048659]|uniref:hypothetical protein n=1 Tax=Streptomyces sp. NPDC048659 TaxID=3155489 RepID=UPI0034429A02
MALPDSTPRRTPAAEVVTRTRLPRQTPARTPGCRRGEVPVEVGADELRVRFLLCGLGVVL